MADATDKPALEAALQLATEMRLNPDGTQLSVPIEKMLAFALQRQRANA